MDIITQKEWDAYTRTFAYINDTASQEMLAVLAKYDVTQINQDFDAMVDLIDFAYGISQKYGEASSALACEFYELMAERAGIKIDPAMPAATATYQEVVKAVRGTLPMGNSEIVAGAVERLVKLAGEDTMIQNAQRDADKGAQLAWIPHGSTCAFCITLGSRGWDSPFVTGIEKGKHAAHVHANCDCSYAVRFGKDQNIGGYKPEELEKMYYGADGSTSKERINSMRREFYKKNSEEINAQKRDAYEKRKERESSAAEETIIS